MKKIILTILFIIVVAGVSGGGVYLWQRGVSNKEKENLTSELNTLQKQSSQSQAQQTATQPQKNIAANDTASWKTYTDTKNSFNFKYPSDAVIDPQEKSFAGTSLSVQVDKMNAISDAPLRWDGITAQEDLAAIKKGDPTTAIGMAVNNSYKLLSIDGAYGKEMTTLSVLQTCDVEFNRTAIIYKDDLRIIITFSDKNIKSLENANSSYFINDQSQCSGLRWNDYNGFYNDLAAGKTDSLSQQWFKDFDTIISTFRFTK